ncbi:MAG TPA: uroporphyrinogen-III C-methyltransferase [Burkholderiaceae bacterium]|nr:uroporphyrinogen-III C-methyltransferase [Burkholderiaceae bacterium]
MPELPDPEHPAVRSVSERAGGAGRVSLVGAGPGDPELLTRRAWRVLGEADVVLHDTLVDPRLRDAAPAARWIAVGKRFGRASTDQRFINRLIVSYARQGRTVVRLKGGDPSIFARASEEIAACRAAGVPVDVVPGVTAACAAAADLQASLTLRGVARSVAFVTPRVGHGQLGGSGWIDAAVAADTVALYMAGAELSSVAEQLIGAGRPPRTPACVVENAGGRGLRLVTTLAALRDVQGFAAQGPVIVLVGNALAAVPIDEQRPDIAPAVRAAAPDRMLGPTPRTAPPAALAAR